MIVDSWLKGATKMMSADIGRELKAPRYVVVHYTAGGSTSGAVASLTRKDENYVSAHFVIGRDGALVQCVPLHRVAYHAGESAWKGLTALNGHSIGIELVNPGWRRTGFMYPDWPTVTATHKHGGPERAWFLYPEEQYATLNKVLTELYEAFPSIEEVIGHDDIAPKRKLDPGPALDWTRVRQPHTEIKPST